MIVTRKQQEDLVNKYIEEKHSQEKCSGFIDGIEAALKMIDKQLKQQRNENNT